MSYFAHSDQLPEWTAQIPEGWGTDWLKWSVGLCTQRASQEEQAALPYISNEDLASWTGKLLVDEPHPSQSDGRVFKENDVLFNKLRPYLAKVYRATFDGTCSSELLCLRPSAAVDSRFLYYVLASKGFIDTIDAETFGAKMPRADWEIVGHQLLPLPSIRVQRRISQFLDEKTERIDALIEKKQELLDRLAEKRQALVTRAATKGLDPNAPMKPSGIDWLGDIPAHWRVKRFRFTARLISGSTPTKSNTEYWDGDIPWFSAKDMKVDELFSSVDHVTEYAVSDYRLKLYEEDNAVIVIRGMILARNVPVAVARGPFTINQDMKVIQSKGEVIPEYFQMYLSAIKSFLLTLVGEAGHGTKALRTDVLSDVPVLLPPLEEQHSLTSELGRDREKVNAAIEKIGRTIEHLSEYRSALITAAVTGKITELI